MAKEAKHSKHFFLISFLPAIAYWYLEEFYPVRIAVIGGLSLACLEMLLEKIFTKHVHTISRFNFFLILCLGGISLIGDEGIWFKLQPCFTGVGVGAYLLIRLYKGKSLLAEMSEGMGKPLPHPELVKIMERDLGFLFFFYGLFMAWIAHYATTGWWVFFKTPGFFITFVIFGVIQILLMRSRVRKMMIQEMESRRF